MINSGQTPGRRRRGNRLLHPNRLRTCRAPHRHPRPRARRRTTTGRGAGPKSQSSASTRTAYLGASTSSTGILRRPRSLTRPHPRLICTRRRTIPPCPCPKTCSCPNRSESRCSRVKSCLTITEPRGIWSRRILRSLHWSRVTGSQSSPSWSRGIKVRVPPTPFHLCVGRVS